MKTFEVDVIQFLRPHGRAKKNSTSLPESCQALYEDMLKHNCHFEAEVLTNGLVSTTISNDVEDLDISITDNGPNVQIGMEKMLKRKRWKKEKMSE